MEPSPTLDLEVLRRWVGRSVTTVDHLDPAQAHRLAHALDQSADLAPGSPLPDLWHWVYCRRFVPTAELGSDGHEERGRFLPPVAFARRLWAGGRLRFHGPLLLGETAQRISTVVDVQVKEGRTGVLCFVTVEHHIAVEGERRITETQDLVYTDSSSPPQEVAAPADAAWSSEVVASPVLLFRYSALTSNAHRIHYDRVYCEEVEHLPGVVVHGPLVATLLAGLVSHEKPLRSFAFRAMAPLHDGLPFTLNGRPSPDGAALWAADGHGRLAMTAEAVW